MCNFFSFVTEPDSHGGERFYFDWNYRKDHLKDDPQPSDSHSSICKHFGLTEDICNKYEFNPLTKKFVIDRINHIDDRIQAEEWVNNLDFKKIVEPLIIKPIVNPFDLPIIEVPTKEHILLLKEWASVWASVGDSVWASVWASVRASVGASVGAYCGSFVKADYKIDIDSSNKLWESGLVPSFDGKMWRLHSGKDAKIVFEISQEDLKGR